MIIQLMEDDGILFDGKPKNVVIQVTFDDGRKLRVPYLASKSISALYKDMNVINQSGQKISNIINEWDEAKSNGSFKVAEDIVVNSLSGSGIIEKEDIVKCIKVEDRGKGATVDIVVGGEYRVLKVTKQNDVLTSYDVIDDKSATPRRIYVMPHEIELLRKRKPAPKFEQGKMESTFKCDMCQKLVACVKEDDEKYHGTCIDCGTVLTKELVAK